MNVESYRYSYFHKADIEIIVAKLLTSRMIRPSQSPFSFLVLLSRKFDGSWRICINHKVLNETIIKVKYPIPIVDELLDEIFASTVFTKLDLRSGYHKLERGLKLYTKQPLEHIKGIMKSWLCLFS